jgi:prepilin-type processing-associated H-X9-DG protein
MQCSNNLKQLALGIHNFEGVYQRFPSGINLPISTASGAVFPTNVLYTSGKIGLPPFPDQFGSWMEYLLPYVEQDNIFKSLNFNVREYGNALGTGSVGANVINLFICPSDPLSAKVTQYTTGGNTYYFGLNSYLANAGTISWYVSDGTFDGVFQINSRTKIADILDGTSNTLMLGERYHRDPCFNDQIMGGIGKGIDLLGGWAWANYSAGQDYLGGARVPVNYQLAPCTSRPPFTLTDPRTNAYGSGHPGGAMFAFCDGSVRFLSLTTTDQLATLQLLARPQDGQVVNVP